MVVLDVVGKVCTVDVVDDFIADGVEVRDVDHFCEGLLDALLEVMHHSLRELWRGGFAVVEQPRTPAVHQDHVFEFYMNWKFIE